MEVEAVGAASSPHEPAPPMRLHVYAHRGPSTGMSAAAAHWGMQLVVFSCFVLRQDFAMWFRLASNTLGNQARLESPASASWVCSVLTGSL